MMEALYLLVPMSVAVVFFTIWLFFNASDGGQFDDLVGPGMRILQDDDRTCLGDNAVQRDMTKATPMTLATTEGTGAVLPK